MNHEYDKDTLKELLREIPVKEEISAIISDIFSTKLGGNGSNNPILKKRKQIK